MKPVCRNILAGSFVLVTALGALAILRAPSGLSRGDESATAQDPAEEEVAPPNISLSVNGVSDAVVREGDSLLIEAAFTPAEGALSKVPIVLEGGAAGWGSVARLAILNAQGQPVSAGASRLTTKTDPNLTLDANGLGSLVWIVEFSGSAKLTPGAYTVVVRFDNTSSTSGGWKGRTESYPSSLTVRPAGSLSTEEAIFAIAAQARIHSAAGRLPEGLSVCDQYLAKNSKDGAIREVRADLLADSGKYEEAFAAYNELLAEFKLVEKKPTNELPVLLQKKRDLVLEELKKK